MSRVSRDSAPAQAPRRGRLQLAPFLGGCRGFQQPKNLEFPWNLCLQLGVAVGEERTSLNSHVLHIVGATCTSAHPLPAHHTIPSPHRACPLVSWLPSPPSSTSLETYLKMVMRFWGRAGGFTPTCFVLKGQGEKAVFAPLLVSPPICAAPHHPPPPQQLLAVHNHTLIK